MKRHRQYPTRNDNATTGYGTGSGAYEGFINGPVLQSGTTFSDSDAQNAVRTLLDQGQITGNNKTVFVLNLPDGVTSKLSGDQSCTAFCGYHDAFDYNGTSSSKLAPLC